MIDVYKVVYYTATYNIGCLPTFLVSSNYGQRRYCTTLCNNLLRQYNRMSYTFEVAKDDEYKTGYIK